MLSSMNVTVIPFLLGAVMSVKDVTQWNFGPEYVFQLNKTTIVFKNRIEFQDITAKVNCRPKVSSQNTLLCHAHEIIISMLKRRMYKTIRTNTITRIKGIIPLVVSNKMSDQLFEIQFGRQGVQSVQGVKVETRRKQAHHYDSVTDIVEQFHIGIDLSVAAGESMKNYENVKSGSHVISSFPQNEDTTRAKCSTSCIITYTPANKCNKNGEFKVRRNKMKFDFHLRLLPISYTNPNSKTFSIKRTRMTCTHQPQYLTLFDEKWKIRNMTEYFNKMEIHDKKPRFTSHTHLEGNVFFPRNMHAYYFSEDVYLHLLRIRPAQNNNTAEYE
nr:PREDICTED: uncharacterized protein LOC105674404 [Linepithema humile]